jgi:hypothetical protein
MSGSFIVMGTFSSPSLPSFFLSFSYLFVWYRKFWGYWVLLSCYLYNKLNEVRKIFEKYSKDQVLRLTSNPKSFFKFVFFSLLGIELKISFGSTSWAMLPVLVHLVCFSDMVSY